MLEQKPFHPQEIPLEKKIETRLIASLGHLPDHQPPAAKATITKAESAKPGESNSTSINKS